MTLAYFLTSIYLVFRVKGGSPSLLSLYLSWISWRLNMGKIMVNNHPNNHHFLSVYIQKIQATVDRICKIINVRNPVDMLPQLKSCVGLSKSCQPGHKPYLEKEMGKIEYIYNALMKQYFDSLPFQFSLIALEHLRVLLKYLWPRHLLFLVWQHRHFDWSIGSCSKFK